MFLFSSDSSHQNTNAMRLIYPEVLLKRRGLELLPLAEPLHYCREIIFAITIAGGRGGNCAGRQFCWYAQNDREMCSRMDKGPEVLADLIPKVLGFSTPFFKDQKYFIHIDLSPRITEVLALGKKMEMENKCSVWPACYFYSEYMVSFWTSWYMLTCLDFLNSEVLILFHISDLSTWLRSLTLVSLWVCWHLSLPLLGLDPLL